MDKFRLTLVACDDVASTWPNVRHFIEQACLRGPGSLIPDRLREACRQGFTSLFIIEKSEKIVGAVAATVVTDFSGRKIIEWTALGGIGLRDWFPIEDLVLAQARAIGCVAARSFSRPGMARIMGARGYRKTGVILEKEWACREFRVGLFSLSVHGFRKTLSE